jgi:hypothetical protein
MEGFMKYAVEMTSSGKKYIQMFINIGSGVEKLLGIDGHTHRQQGDLISILSFCK